ADDAPSFLVASRYHDEGTQIAFAGTRPLQGSGELLRLYPEKLTTATTLRLIRASFNDGRIEGSSEAPSTQAKPGSFRLLPNVPNPFNPETVIRYELPRTSEVTLQIFNAIGQQVRNFAYLNQVAGTYRVRWDGRDAYGNKVAGGMYFYCLTTDRNRATQKMVLLK
ncbi:MAG: T9SS type A sorting domain-containing protein, partial [Gemmatimonadetes bacterium]|nr:T9SS type A sorting domain-containing protein [Gemmatimonadota bacterium]